MLFGGTDDLNDLLKVSNFFENVFSIQLPSYKKMGTLQN